MDVAIPSAATKHAVSTSSGSTGMSEAAQFGMGHLTHTLRYFNC